jgi:uncharacterized repeat protein (TIGR02543 family)
MKPSTKIILPIIIISALLILLTGCFGIPDDESPGYTDTYTMTTVVIPEYGGAINGGGTYAAGTVVNITATPTSGYQFINWIGDVANTSLSATTVTMDDDKTVIAIFSEIPSNGSPEYTPGSITGFIMVPEDCSECLTDGDCLNRSISDVVPDHWVAAEEAIVTVIPHATLTDEYGQYTLTDIEPGVYYVITATYKNVVLKDVVEPDGVEAGEIYDAGTANCESTALALVVEYLWDMGLDAEEIEVELADYITTDKFVELVDTVCCIIEDCDNITNYCCLVECDEPGYTPELESITVNTGSMNLCFEEFRSISPLVSVIAHYTEGEPSKVVTSSATITYTSNDPSIASISGTTVTAGNSEASTSINVSATYTEEDITVDSTGTVPVTVIDCSTCTPELESLTVVLGKTTPMTLCNGATTTITSDHIASIIAHYTCDAPEVDLPLSACSYESEDSGIASVAGLYVTGNSVGNTNIVVSYTDGDKTVSATQKVPVDVIDCTNYYTLTMAVNPTGGGTTDPAVGSHTYPENEVVTLIATAASGYRFVDWTGDASGTDPTTSVTMDGNKTVTANFARENIITSINIAGWENASCQPNFDHPHLPYSYTYSDPSGISGLIGRQWLTVTNPNLKSVHFYINFEGNGDVTYEYTDTTGADHYVSGTLTGESVLSSECIEIPGDPSTSDYPHHFYIKIYVDNVLTCTIHLW